MRHEDASTPERDATPMCDTTPERDTTLEALATVIDGSLSGLARYHLLRHELETIRALPERRDRGRIPSAPAGRR
jgi:hypothetical protein